jgi:phage tail protein X
MKTAIAALALLALGAAPQPKDQDYISHTVRQGESVSLICLRYYGRYSTELGAAIRTANPSLRDVNLIRPGQKLRLRKPIPPAQAARSSLPPKEAQLYEKKVSATQGVATFVQGTAVLKRGKEQPAKLTVNTVVQPGDIIETGSDGRVEIIINRESVVRCNANTRLTVAAFRDNATKEGRTRISFSLGTLWTQVRKMKDKICRFELELPNAIAGVHGTTYQTTVAEDASAEVKVYDGEVAVKGKPAGQAPAPPGPPGEVAGPQEVPGPQEVTMEQWIHIVRSMQKITIDKAGKPAPPVEFKKKKQDEWEHFNEERDRWIADIVAGF